jgi:hypothetical protein
LRLSKPLEGTVTTPGSLRVIAPRLADGLLWGRCTIRKAYNHDDPHPIRILASSLDDKRPQLIEKLVTDTSISADVTKELATVQAALTAVRALGGWLVSAQCVPTVSLDYMVGSRPPPEPFRNQPSCSGLCELALDMALAQVRKQGDRRA